MPAYPWLALPKRQRQFAYRKLAFAQKGQHPEPRLLARSAQRADYALGVAPLADGLGWRYKHIFIWHKISGVSKP